MTQADCQCLQTPRHIKEDSMNNLIIFLLRKPEQGLFFIFNIIGAFDNFQKLPFILEWFSVHVAHCPRRETR
jgi:hypothetical protein